MSEQKHEFLYIVRIIGTDIKGDKTVSIGLTKIRGIDMMFSNAVVSISGISRNKKIGDLTPEDVKKLEEVINNPLKHGIPVWLINRRKDLSTGVDKHTVGSDIKLQSDFDLRRMKSISSYKGLRHSWHLKVRGQRTKSTGRKGGPVARGKKKTVRK